jgi:hypothetical protein
LLVPSSQASAGPLSWALPLARRGGRGVWCAGPCWRARSDAFHLHVDISICRLLMWVWVFRGCSARQARRVVRVGVCLPDMMKDTGDGLKDVDATTYAAYSIYAPIQDLYERHRRRPSMGCCCAHAPSSVSGSLCGPTLTRYQARRYFLLCVRCGRRDVLRLPMRRVASSCAGALRKEPSSRSGECAMDGNEAVVSARCLCAVWVVVGWWRVKWESRMSCGVDVR